MRRREFIAVVSFAGAWSLPLVGQQLKRLPRIGFLGLGSSAAHARFLKAFRGGLRDHGYIEPETITVEYRWADGQYYPSLRPTSCAKASIWSRRMDQKARSR